MSQAQDHLAKAKDYIAKGEDYYRKAAEEIAVAMEERPELTWVEVGRQLGRSPQWARRLVTSFRNRSRASDEPFVVDWGSGSNKRDEVAARVLSDPEQLKQVIATLPSAVRESVIAVSHDAEMRDLRARQGEHDTTPQAPTAREVMGDDRFDPSESWADEHIVRVREKAHTLRRQTEKWGLVLGSLTEEQAYDYLLEAEKNIAEARVVLQERMADRNRVEA